MDVAAAVSEARQWDRLMTMARLGAIPGDGVNRPALSGLDREARRVLIGWGRELGLTASVDRMANLFLRCEGAEPGLAPVMAGSHMDSQPSGGRFDGIWGVIAALEAVQAMQDAGIRPRRAVEVVAWTNEEGSRFAPGCMGSMAFGGFQPPETWDDSKDTEGLTFGAELAALLESERDLPRRPLGVVEGAAPFAYVEAHIEQGPRLEAGGIDIGVVTGIQGARWFTVEVTGRSDHAGTAPLSLRKDALQDSVRAITALNALMADPEDVLRFTVGRVEVSPNSSNTVPDRVLFSIDLRHPDAAVLRAKGEAVAAVVEGAVTACAVSVTERFYADPSVFAPEIVGAIESAAARLSLRSMRMPSGAFHDARFLAPVCPAGMIFVPSRGGISHHPSEYSSPAQLAAGTRVLASVVAELANR